MDGSTTGEWLSTALGQATRSAKFCVVGGLPVVDPGIEVDGVGAIALPLKRTTAKELVASCQVAPHGKGAQTLVNKKVRNTFELDPKSHHLPVTMTTPYPFPSNPLIRVSSSRMRSRSPGRKARCTYSGLLAGTFAKRFVWGHN